MANPFRDGIGVALAVNPGLPADCELDLPVNDVAPLVAVGVLGQDRSRRDLEEHHKPLGTAHLPTPDAVYGNVDLGIFL